MSNDFSDNNDSDKIIGTIRIFFGEYDNKGIKREGIDCG
jgi:hypothetical protein